ncbi:hypothetical protein DS739_07085 [Acetobacter sp. JWB]|nr:hypothetical protein CPF11_00580 [Acetobacter pomorum]AXC26576.1 hypothetical protein DS739_07085 [Acetobacter sp. JWB]
MEPDMGLKISLANTSFARSLEFVPASDATITDWYVFGDRTGSGSVTDGLINQAAGAKAPTVTGAADIIVRANSIIVNNTKSAIISNLPGSGDFTAFAVVVPDFFNAATAATGQGNPVVAGMLGVIPFGNILGGTSLSGVVVQANAQSADTFNWQGFSQGVYSGFSTLHQIFNPSIPVPIGTAPILVALVQSVATKTVTFYDLTNAPSQALSAGPMGTGYNVATSNLVVGGSYDADIGNGPCLGAQLSFWCGSNRAMTQPEVQSMAANIRRFMLNRGVVVG